MCNLCSNLSQFQFTLDREHPWTLHLLLPGNMTNSIVSNPVRARNDIDYHETRFAPSPPITGMIQVRLRHYQSSPGRIVTLTIQLKQPEENTICFVHEGGQMIIKAIVVSTADGQAITPYTHSPVFQNGGVRPFTSDLKKFVCLHCKEALCWIRSVYLDAGMT